MKQAKKVYTKPVAGSIVSPYKGLRALVGMWISSRYDYVAIPFLKVGDIIHVKLGCQNGVVIASASTQLKKYSRLSAHVVVHSVDKMSDGKFKITCHMVATNYSNDDLNPRGRFMKVVVAVCDMSDSALRLKSSLRRRS